MNRNYFSKIVLLIGITTGSALSALELPEYEKCIQRQLSENLDGEEFILRKILWTTIEDCRNLLISETATQLDSDVLENTLIIEQEVFKNLAIGFLESLQ